MEMGLFFSKRKYTEDEIDLMKYNLVFEIGQFYDRDTLKDLITKKESHISFNNKRADRLFEKYLMSVEEIVKTRYDKEYKELVERIKTEKHELAELKEKFNAFDRECERLESNYATMIN